MPAVLHIVDAQTPPQVFRQLGLLVGAGDAVVSAGPPAAGPIRLPIRPVHEPLGSVRLAALAMRPNADRADILHAWSPRAMEAGRELALAAGKPLVASLSCVPGGRELESLRRAVGPGLFRLTVPTEAGRRRLLAGGLPEQFLHVLPPAALAPPDAPAARRKVRQALGLGDADRLIIAPEAMVRGAGHEYASWAHAILRQVTCGLRLLFPGGGPLGSHVRSFASTTGYDDEVFFTEGRFTAEEALAASDLAAFFPWRDVGVICLAEAMVAGLPIAASSLPELVDCLAEGEAATLVPTRDPRAAAAALLKLAEQPELAARLGDAARRRAAERFNPPAVRARLEEIYAAALAAAA